MTMTQSTSANFPKLRRSFVITSHGGGGRQNLAELVEHDLQFEEQPTCGRYARKYSKYALRREREAIFLLKRRFHARSSYRSSHRAAIKALRPLDRQGGPMKVSSAGSDNESH